MPNGHIQLHHTRPSIIVIAMTTRPQTRLRYRVWVVSAVATATSGVASRNRETGQPFR